MRNGPSVLSSKGHLRGALRCEHLHCLLLDSMCFPTSTLLEINEVILFSKKKKNTNVIGIPGLWREGDVLSVRANPER